MKQFCILLAIFFISTFHSHAQFRVNYNPAEQSTGNIQYFKPAGNLFVGDCIPFYHNQTYYLYWLLDSAHHAALNGLGGHQWVLSTSTDLKNWKHHPIVIGIDEDWEKSICTGSVVYANNQFYAFYATRLINKEGKVNEQLSYAISKDGIHFEKQQPNPFYTSAPGYSQRDFRDPKVIVDSGGTFHLFVSSSIDQSMSKANGAMVHLVSKDLKKWTVKDPLIINQDDVPECPDYFQWKGWYYLVYGRGGNTFYLKSRKPYGPWEYPSSQVLDEDWSNVVKTAEFTNGRRIAAGWIPSRREDKDDGHEIFGGNIVLRELIQLPDGTLATKFAAETIPASGSPLQLEAVVDSLTKKSKTGEYVITSPGGLGSFHFDNLPDNVHIKLEILPKTNVEEYGFFLRASDKTRKGYKLSFQPNNQIVRLHNTDIKGVTGLNSSTTVEIIIKGDIIDVCIGNRRCIVNRLNGQRGSQLWFYAKHGTAAFRSITVAPLEENIK